MKPVTEFYSNKDWSEQLGLDCWCKECVSKCSNKDEVMEYFWENNREWNERIWQSAKTKAEKSAIVDERFQKATEDRRERIVERLTCQNVPAVMKNYYKFIDRDKTSKSLSYKEAKENGEIVIEDDPDLKIYSPEFNGYYKPSEIDYLSTYYEKLVSPTSPYNLQDYAKKLVKASWQADRAQSDYAAGKCDFTVVKDALSLFDMLSKSALFAECKRKPDEGTNVLSICELVDHCEKNGHPCTRKIEWEQDDIDKTISEFRYTFEALGLDNA